MKKKHFCGFRSIGKVVSNEPYNIRREKVEMPCIALLSNKRTYAQKVWI